MATSKTTKPELSRAGQLEQPADEVGGSKLEPPTDEIEISTPSAPAAPSFGLCAGTVADLEQVDKTVDPFTGKVVTRADVK